MKTRQFRQLGGLAPAKRLPLIVEGLTAIGTNVARLAADLEQCNEAKAHRAARLLRNVGREEAGKFLVLIDAYRAPTANQTTISRQFSRAGDHLSKLVYAQMADYLIASRNELASAVARHRPALRLDGPNNYDWILRNDLLTERDGALYVDLLDYEGALEWCTPDDRSATIGMPPSMRLVQAIRATGLVSPAGLGALSQSWSDFDPEPQSHCWEWAERTKRALETFPQESIGDDGWHEAAAFAIDRWPMPMVEFEVEQTRVTVDEMAALRATRYDDEMMRAWGYPQAESRPSPHFPAASGDYESA